MKGSNLPFRNGNLALSGRILTLRIGLLAVPTWYITLTRTFYLLWMTPTASNERVSWNSSNSFQADQWSEKALRNVTSRYFLLTRIDRWLLLIHGCGTGWSLENKIEKYKKLEMMELWYQIFVKVFWSLPAQDRQSGVGDFQLVPLSSVSWHHTWCVTHPLLLYAFEFLVSLTRFSLRNAEFDTLRCRSMILISTT